MIVLYNNLYIKDYYKKDCLLLKIKVCGNFVMK